MIITTARRIGWKNASCGRDGRGNATEAVGEIWSCEIASIEKGAISELALAFSLSELHAPIHKNRVIKPSERRIYTTCGVFL